MTFPSLFRIAVCLVLGLLSGDAAALRAKVRVKDIATVQGLQDVQVIGYGLVVGLDKTGDGRGSIFTVQSMANMLARMGILVPAEAIRPKNVAAVMVTADIGPFARRGSRVDVLVSSLGDATSLEGGTLLLTPLSGKEGQAVSYTHLTLPTILRV